MRSYDKSIDVRRGGITEIMQRVFEACISRRDLYKVYEGIRLFHEKNTGINMLMLFENVE